ncbi:MAG: cytochrome c [Myxococcales bacterium]|nr:cytochrome c [Myxococcales bacterium]
MDRRFGAAACGLGMALSIACGGETPPAESPSSKTASGATNATNATNATFEAQAAEGQKLYAANCASCHGAGGEGGKAPPVVGVSQGALPLDPPTGAKYRKTQFRSAADVATFVVKSMPPGEAGKLTEEQYWAILAFDLKANGVDLGAKRLDASSAPSVVLHP